MDLAWGEPVWTRDGNVWKKLDDLKSKSGYTSVLAAPVGLYLAMKALMDKFWPKLREIESFRERDKLVASMPLFKPMIKLSSPNSFHHFQEQPPPRYRSQYGN